MWRDAGPGVLIRLSDGRGEVAKKLTRDPDLFLLAEEEGRIVGVVMGAWDGRRPRRPLAPYPSRDDISRPAQNGGAAA